MKLGYIYKANVINGGESVYSQIGNCYDWEKRKDEIDMFNNLDDELSNAINDNEGVWDMELIFTMICDDEDDHQLIEMTDLLDAKNRGIPITADNRYLWDTYDVENGCWVGDN